MTAPLKPVDEASFAECVGFVARHESRCVTLMSNLVKDGNPEYPHDAVRSFVRLGNQSATEGVLLVTRTGILLHCLDDKLDRAPAAPRIRQFLSAQNVRCIIGAGDDTQYLESLMPFAPERAVDYRLMTLETIPPPEAAVIAITGADGSKPEIRHATPADARDLLDLQEGYEREEVIPPGDPFDRDHCLLNLEKNLASQIVFVARSGSKAIAKAGTNARGLHLDQLGGVYTAPDWRNRGLASALVAQTARDRMQKGRNVVLFVKLTNASAIRAYQKVGFRPDIPFRISYF
jgi:predicted GNAT family acetyltransferase